MTSTWFLLYPSSSSARTSSGEAGADVGSFVWMTLAGLLGLRICANAVWFYHFCVDWNAVTQREWADLAALHFFQQNFVTRKRQIQEALITTSYSAARKSVKASKSDRRRDSIMLAQLNDDGHSNDHNNHAPISHQSRPQHEQSTTSCPICLCDYHDKDLVSRSKNSGECSHMFHSACLQLWLSKHTSCPVCRYEMVPPMQDTLTVPVVSQGPGVSAVAS